MSRLLFWLALICLVVFAIRSKIREAQQRARSASPDEAARPARQADAQAETMLECAHCGVFYPASETVQAGGRDYCCAAHAAKRSA